MNNYKHVLLNLSLILLTLILISCNTSQELEEGTYTSTEKSVALSIKLYDGNQYMVNMDGEIAVEGVYEIKNNRLYITDKKGPYACLENPNATYRWIIKDNKVTLIVVKDECSGRKAALTSQSFIME